MIFHMFKRSLLFLLTILVLTAVPATAVPAHAAGKINATKITLKAQKNYMTVGQTLNVSIKLNKKNTKNVKVYISVKSNVKANKSNLTIKKGITKASFKITAKKAGFATITAQFRTAKGKMSQAKIRVSVTEKDIQLSGVTLDKDAPRIGDTLTATIHPSNATGVTYAWYSGDTADAIVTEIKNETGPTLLVSKDMAGKYIKVVATGADGIAEAAATTPVLIPVESVSLNYAAPETGDTLTAAINPADADNVTYAWYSGNSKTDITTIIEGATQPSLYVTTGMAGKYIKVVVTGAADSKADAATNYPVTIPTPPSPSPEEPLTPSF